MRKEVLIIFLILFLGFTFISAATNASASKAYDCLLSKVEGSKCSSSSLTLEDKIFSLLATKQCKTEVLSEKSSQDCWPSSACDIKITAEALLALKNVDYDTSDGASWLLSHNMTPTGLTWFLQIDSNDQTTCSLTYDTNSNTDTVIIGADKKIQSVSGGCFEKSSNGYWLHVLGSCYDREFHVSCDKTFLTNLLYQDSGSNVFYISSQTNSGSAGGETVEKINSFCFAKGSSCTYEGSLWAALVLNYLGYDISSFIPYLMTGSDSNEQYIPESFLYYLKGYPELRSKILTEQKDNKYWKESSDQFYDTAVALYPFVNEQLTQKTNAQNWLLSIENSNGCWSTSVKNTAFLLNSLWPENSPSGPECSTKDDCSSDEKCLYGNCVALDAQCISDRHCSSSSKPVCVDNKCVACRYDQECSSSVDKYCSSDNTCVSCVGDSCTEQGSVCSTNSDSGDNFCISGHCIECNSAHPCSTGYECSTNNSCIKNSGEECNLNSDCGSNQVCDNGSCVAQALSCDSQGYQCRFRSDCQTDLGIIKDNYNCNTPLICCSVVAQQKTCTGSQGVICNSNQDCSGTYVTASDLSSGESCCVGGTCQAITPSLSECENNGGTCKSSCSSTETISSETCVITSDSCCMLGSTPTSSSYLWLWVLGILIIIVIIGIIFRNKLRMFFLRFKGTGGPRPRPGPGSGFPPMPTGTMRPPIQRRILPPEPRRPISRTPAQKPKEELDEVLNKLKEMGK